MLGWLVAGMGVVGQPHIMVRTMAVDAVETCLRPDASTSSERALCRSSDPGRARALLTGAEVQADPEARPSLLALQLLPGPVVGLILAGLFAATMSTADSRFSPARRP